MKTYLWIAFRSGAQMHDRDVDVVAAPASAPLVLERAPAGEAPLSRKQRNRAIRREYQLARKREKQAARLLQPVSRSAKGAAKSAQAVALRTRPCIEPVAAGCIAALVSVATAVCVLPVAASAALFALAFVALTLLQRDRWSVVRLHDWRWVRQVYQSLAIYSFVWRLTRAYRALPRPASALEVHPAGAALLETIIATGPDTFQSKLTNRVQIESLLACVRLVVLV